MSAFSKVSETYKKLENKKYFYLAASVPWIIYVVWMACSMLKKGYISYETNDDPFLNLLVSGTLGHTYARNVFNNVVFGWILTVLYNIAPAHNWLTIVHFLLYFFGMLFFGVFNILRNNVLKGYLSNLILLWATVYTMICRISFAKTSAFAVAIGLFILGVNLDGETYKSRGNRIVQALAAIYMIIGGLIRKETMYGMTPFMAVFVFYFVLKYKKESIKRLNVFFASCAIIIIAWIGNAVAYNADPEWKYFVEFNKARAELLDYGFPEYEDYKDEYEAIGFDEIDAEMLSNWCYADADIFSIEKIRQIISFREMNKEKEPFVKWVQDIGKSFVELAELYKSVYTLLFLFLALCIGVSNKSFGYLLLTFILGIGEIVGLVVIDRYPERAVLIAVIATCILMLLFSNEEGVISKDKWIHVVCLGFVALYAYFGCSYTNMEIRYQNVRYDKSYSDAFFTYLENHSDNLYVIDVDIESSFVLDAYSPLDHPNEYMRTNLAMTGGWQIPSPAYLNNIEKYGDKYNLFKTMAENENVYWITDEDPKGQILPYYMEYHYGVSTEVTDNIAGIYNVVAFSREN